MAHNQHQPSSAFVLITSASPDLKELTEKLRDFSEVAETAILYGQYDIVAILRDVEEARVNEMVQTVSAWPQVNFAHAEIAEVGSGFLRPLASAGTEHGSPTEALVEMTVDADQGEHVLAQLHEVAEVAEARVVGENRILCWLYGPSKESIDRAVMEKLRGVEGVFATSTYLVVGAPGTDYRWSRAAGSAR